MLISESTTSLTNQDFCYWLQGYFEISLEAKLEAHQIDIILEYLNKISEPLGPMTSWLKEVCLYCQDNGYRQETLAHFLPLMKAYLGNIFYHVIDNSYDTDRSSDDLQKIHDGVKND